MKLFGATEAGVRLGDLSYTMLVIPFLYLLVNNLFGRRAALFATLTWALFHTAVNTLYFWSGAESETFMVLPLILATYCYRRAEQKDANPANNVAAQIIAPNPDPVTSVGAQFIAPHLQGGQDGVEGVINHAPTENVAARTSTSRIGWPWLVATGFFVGIGVMIKVTEFVGVGGLVIYALITTLRDYTGWTRLTVLLQRLGLALLGFVLAVLPFVLYFVLNHALAEAIDVSIVANFFYGGAGNSLTVAGSDLLGRIGDDLFGLRFYYVLPALALLYALLRERSRELMLVALWLAGTFGMTWIQGRLWPYHYIGTLVPLAILCGFILDRAVREIDARTAAPVPPTPTLNATPLPLGGAGGGSVPLTTAQVPPTPTPNATPLPSGGAGGGSVPPDIDPPLTPPSGRGIMPTARGMRFAGYVAVAMIALGLALWSLLPNNGTETFYSWDRYLQYQSGKISQRQYYADFHRGTYDYLPNRDAGEYIGAHTQPGQTALVWAVDPLVNLIAGRLAPGRFIYNYPIVAEEVPEAARDQYKQIFLDEFNRNPPQIIAVAENDTSPITPQDSLALLATFPAFGQILTKDYHLVTEIPQSPNHGETFLMYERNK
jgi:hypothetical protein